MNMIIINEIKNKHSIFIHLPNFMNKNYINELEQITNWRGGDYSTQNVNRSQQFFHINDEPFCKLWKKNPERWQSMPYYSWLLEMQIQLQRELEETISPLYEAYGITPLNFKSALINKYKDGNDFIPPHFDTTDHEEPTIVSVSFGATRTFVVKRILFDQEREYKYELNHGDVFIMAGLSQRNFTHEILKDSTIENPRYNITFRG